MEEIVSNYIGNQIPELWLLLNYENIQNSNSGVMTLKSDSKSVKDFIGNQIPELLLMNRMEDINGAIVRSKIEREENVDLFVDCFLSRNKLFTAGIMSNGGNIVCNTINYGVYSKKFKPIGKPGYPRISMAKRGMLSLRKGC